MLPWTTRPFGSSSEVETGDSRRIRGIVPVVAKTRQPFFFLLLLTEMGCAHGTAVNANEFKHGGHMVEPDVTWPKHLGEKDEIRWIFCWLLKWLMTRVHRGLYGLFL